MLIYTGGGYGGAVGNVPARDLTDEEVEQCGGEKILLATNCIKSHTAIKPYGTSTRTRPQKAAEVNNGRYQSTA